MTGSAVPIPSDSDYQTTADGHLIYEEQAEICAEAGFPPGKMLPVTGGTPLLLAPLVLLLGAWFLARSTVFR